MAILQSVSGCVHHSLVLCPVFPSIRVYTEVSPAVRPSAAQLELPEFFFFIELLLFAIFFKFIYLILAVLGLRFCARAFSSCSKRGPLFIAVRGPLTSAASLVAEHRLQTRRLSSCGSQA